jgi:hypothetical protein
VAVGWLNITPVEGAQALWLMAGSVISQGTDLPWASLAAGDQLTLPTKAPIHLDYGTMVAPDSYRFGTSGLSQWDPVSWRFEASRDGSIWILLDQKTWYATPATRNVFTESFSLVPTPPLPDPHLFITGIALTDNGGRIQLTWNSQAAASYAIQASDNLTEFSRVDVASRIPSQGSSTVHALARDAWPACFYRILKE